MLHSRKSPKSRSAVRKTALPVVAGALLATAACSGGTSYDKDAAGDGGGKKNGTLTVATTADISTMDPAMHRDRTNQAVIRNVFNALVGQDGDLKPVPELAASWKQTDSRTWKFTLRKGVTFHNGEKFDADAVKYSLERVLDEKQGSPRADMLSVISGIRVEDPQHVEIRTKEPAPTLLAGLSVNEIVPPGYVEKVGDKKFAAKPVGTGPFTFKDWQPNERITLEANRKYWDGAPEVGRVVFRPVPEVSARIAALKSGDADIAAEIPPDQAKELTGDVKAAKADGTRIFYLAMNVTEKPFDDRGNRVAVNRAVDREALVTSLYQGNARPLDQPAFPEMKGYDEDFKGVGHDAAAAKKELADASGTPVRIDAVEADKTLAQAVAGQLEKAGLKASVRVLEEQAFAKRIESGASQAHLSSWGVAEGDADVIFARHFWSPAREDAVYTAYEDKELDGLIKQAREEADQEKREQIYADATKIVMRDAPWAPLLNPQEIYGVSERVQGFTPSSIGRFEVAKTTLAP
ncbi:ABC transporter substrate-binding protein [Streptomyces sp. WMMB 322]|uniref:ABC transporter substrate-binding protein n=1 Tax=Streptomyces sp. WMMB 322 TaxID=1286821 RepID=UPI0006E37C0C|nr:ABC transporter substrate-binding protein [Streptomyces sp. WMMB 322]SCK31243.1 peptide/nickel transport system substrate-binding protein [Streptomyces sp. WMMB 322]